MTTAAYNPIPTSNTEYDAFFFFSKKNANTLRQTRKSSKNSLARFLSLLWITMKQVNKNLSSSPSPVASTNLKLSKNRNSQLFVVDQRRGPKRRTKHPAQPKGPWISFQGRWSALECHRKGSLLFLVFAGFSRFFMFFLVFAGFCRFFLVFPGFSWFFLFFLVFFLYFEYPWPQLLKITFQRLLEGMIESMFDLLRAS